MMNNSKDMNGQFDRMKQLMNYGLNESKKTPYTGVEYSKVAADGKLYGIVREGTKFYIKVSSKKDNVLAENFEYIGGFRNRKDNEYTSFASAQKNFDFKLRSLAEAYGNGKNIVVESWNPDRQEELTVEATEKMKKEISRERQIMENAMSIFNRKPQSAIKPINEACEGNQCIGNGGDPFNQKVDKEFVDSQKATMNEKPGKGGDAKKANKGYKEAPKVESKDANGNPVNEASDQVLGWNRGNDEYMDKSHGTEIGDSQPFDGPEARNIDDGDKKITRSGEEKQGTIHEEDTSMIYTPDNQNSPKPGVGEIGDDDPFDAGEGRQIDEAIDDLEADADLEDGGEPELGDDDLELGGDEEESELDDDNLDLGGEDPVGDEYSDDELDVEDDYSEDGVEERLSSLEDIVNKIADKLGVGTYDDDDLYDDEGFDGDDEDDDAEFELDMDDADADLEDADADLEDADADLEDAEDEAPIEDETAFGDNTVYESRAYRAMKLRESMRRGRRINEGGMTPFKDAGRVPQGNMNKLDDFGKHPTYQKVVMSLPPKDLQEFPDYYDMNDESVRNDSPYGEKIGDGAPFDIDPESIDNAIAESIKRTLKKKR